jgi:pimeloyl-ACP methyl ester carboxylesterase
MAIIKKAYHDTPSGQLHYRYIRSDTGVKKEPLALFHMSASSSASYEPLMQFSASLGHDCYALDMPGFGGSFDCEGLPNTTYYVQLFAKILEELGLFGTGFHIIGHHSGACLSVEMAVLYPEVVRSICLIGPAIMTADERAAMKEKYYAPFNAPVPDGSHLLKTWEYCRMMGVGEDINAWQRESIDHQRAWVGRTQIYGAVWGQDCMSLYKLVTCPMMIMCARDDVLWPYYQFAKSLRPDVRAEEILGANFSPNRDAANISKSHSGFIGNL